MSSCSSCGRRVLGTRTRAPGIGVGVRESRRISGVLLCRPCADALGRAQLYEPERAFSDVAALTRGRDIIAQWNSVARALRIG